MPLASNTKRTNVRFSLLWTALAASLLGACAPEPRLEAQRDDCGVGRQRVCTTFGPAHSCDCQTRSEVDRFLSTFGEPAWLGGTH